MQISKKKTQLIKLSMSKNQLERAANLHILQYLNWLINVALFAEKFAKLAGISQMLLIKRKFASCPRFWVHNRFRQLQ